jgi:hypothetical protein
MTQSAERLVMTLNSKLNGWADYFHLGPVSKAFQARFAGGRHPGLLGRSVREAWPEVADFNDEVLKMLLHGGQTIFYKDRELSLNWDGKFRETVQAFKQTIAKLTPMGRKGTPEELRGLAVRLASDPSSIITGQVFTQNGGWTST